MMKGDNIRLTGDVLTHFGVVPKGSTGVLHENYNKYMSALFVKMDDGRIFNLSTTLFETYTKPKKVRNPEDFGLVGREAVYVGRPNTEHSIAYGGTAVITGVGRDGLITVDAAWVGKFSWLPSEYELAGALRGSRWVHMGDMVEHTDAGGKKDLARVTGLREKNNGDIVVTMRWKDGMEEKFPMGPSDTIKVVHDKRKKGSLTW